MLYTPKFFQVPSRFVLAAALLAFNAGITGSVYAIGDGTTNISDEAVKAERERPKNEFGWTAVIDGKDVAAPSIAMGDENTVKLILDEGKNRNQVMQHLTYLSNTIGPRLTGSSAEELANIWCKEQYLAWGLANARLDKYGECAVRFDRGPGFAKVFLRRERKKDPPKVEAAPASETSNNQGDQSGTSAAKTEPGQPEVEVLFDQLRECQYTTLSWAAGTNGDLQGPVMKEPKTIEEFEAVKDKISSHWMLIEAPPAIGQRGIRGGMGARYSVRIDARRKQSEGVPEADLSLPERIALAKPLGYISTSRDERVWTGAVPGWRELNFETIPQDVHVQVRLSDYDFINSRLADNETIEFGCNMQHTLTKGPIPLYNTVAEIPGTQFPDEVVIVSAHLDSWDGPGSQGTTDNGTGTAVTLEAARILAAVGAKPLRTIRFINWTGEEQGLLGSKGYTEAYKDDLAKVSAVFVDDGGTDYQGGTPAADGMVEFLAAATAPTNYQFYSEVDSKWLNVNIRKNGPRNPRGGGSDHASFNAVGVPGFFWDEVGRADYGYGWHTQHDKLDLAIPEYLIQSATNSAIAAYRLASAPTLLPRDIPESEEEKAAAEKRREEVREERRRAREGAQ
jgi:carboxypeptidase Q